MRRILCVMLLAGAAQAQTFTTLANFDTTNGSYPGLGGLGQGLDGRFYGVTINGGASNFGTVFAVSTAGQLSSLYSFAGPVDENPYPAGLMLARDGTLYGTTGYGGEYSNGTIFTITPGGTLTTLYTFDGTNGIDPEASLVEGFDGMIYGSTERGTGPYLQGTIFGITPGGVLATLAFFDGSYGGGTAAPLVQGSNGSLYGVWQYSGIYGGGAVFSMSPAGVVNRLASFDKKTGYYPIGARVEGTNGNFYGTTYDGGSEAYNWGTVFEITPGGTLTTVHEFNGGDGGHPEGTLIQGTDGNLYGTTTVGGANRYGTIFQISPAGVLTTLHSFGLGDGGSEPVAGLVQGTDGNFYGTTSSGGTSTGGTIFQLSMGLAPFVRTVPWFGKAGETVTILGTDLAGATSVTFNGASAEFTILSATAIRATVPAGATSGKVRVATPGGTLASNVYFQILQ